MSNDDYAVEMALRLKKEYYDRCLWVPGSYPATYKTLKDHLKSRGFSDEWIRKHAWQLK